jgi:hypothetical protein
VIFNLLFAGFAVLMLVRHVPRALRMARSPEGRARLLVPVVNVVLALAILAFALKALISR